MNKITNGFFKDTERTRIFRILEYIERAVNNDKKVIYILGSTYKNIKDIKNLNTRLNIDIIDISSQRKGWLRFVPIPVAKNFLVKVNNKKNIRETFLNLEDHNPISVYIFDKKLEDEFLHNFNYDDLEYMCNLISEDTEYFIYGADFDNEESSTGAMEFISYGKDISKDMRWFL